MRLVPFLSSTDYFPDQRNRLLPPCTEKHHVQNFTRIIRRREKELSKAINGIIIVFCTVTLAVLGAKRSPGLASVTATQPLLDSIITGVRPVLFAAAAVAVVRRVLVHTDHGRHSRAEAADVRSFGLPPPPLRENDGRLPKHQQIVHQARWRKRGERIEWGDWTQSIRVTHP